MYDFIFEIVNNPLIAIIISLAGFLLFWFLVSLLVSRLSGWVRLSEVYPNMTTSEEGQEKKWGGARMNKMANYNGTIIFEATSLGLRMRQIFLFKFGHETLLIPWSDIEQKEVSHTTIGFRFARLPKIKVLVTKSLGEWILEKKSVYSF